MGARFIIDVSLFYFFLVAGNGCALKSRVRNNRVNTVVGSTAHPLECNATMTTHCKARAYVKVS